MLGTSFDATGTVPADGVIQLAFDRYLLPSTITRQSYVILDGRNQLLAAKALRTIYDPVARTVTITGPDGPGAEWLTVDQPYKLVLTVPPNAHTDVGGFRAIDRAPLQGEQPRTFVFRAAPPERAQRPLGAPVDFCADVAPIFQTKCASPTCHGPGTRAASGLVLADAEGVRRTAIGRVAHGANTSARASSPEPPERIFGVNMALIAPGDPGSSWLVYKMELAKPPASAVARPPVRCSPGDGASPIPPPAPDYVPLAPASFPASDAELAVLSDYVLGPPMPYPATAPGYAHQPLTFQERERVRLWIAQGAALRDCGECAEVAPDAADGAL